MPIKKKIDSKLIRFLRSEWSFRLSLFIFWLNSTWIAVTALYPMAFDEQYHIGIIKLYAAKLLPFWSANPPGQAEFGAVARDPSYIYHYLMSFPYRVIEAVIPSQYAQILILRFSSILLFGLGIFIFRKVLLNAGLSRPIVHSSLLIFVLIPLVPTLAAQINYDNLMFLMIALVLWQTQKFAQQLTNRKIIDVKRFAIITLLCMFGSLVKYAFLPVVIGVVIYLATLLFGHYKQRRSLAGVNADIRKSTKKIGLKMRYLLLALFILTFGLFLERYAINAVKYSTPVPECDQVLSVDECLAYGPWRRNYYTKKAKLENRLEKVYSANPIRYLVTLWLSETTFQLLFTIDGPKFDFRVGQPFRILRNSSVAVLLVGIVLVLYHNRYLRKNYHLKLFGVVTITYSGILFLQNYIEFLNLGYPFAIQGRYLIPILPLIIGVMVAAYSRTIGSRRQDIKLYLFLAAFILLITQGGGAGTYILRSSNTWYWPGQLQTNLNNTAKNILKTVNLEHNIQPVEKKQVD